MKYPGIYIYIYACILLTVATFHVSDEFRLQVWLEEAGLGHYVENFYVNDYQSIADVADIDLCEDTFDLLEMDVPAHRKRLTHAGEYCIWIPAQPIT